MKIDQIHIEGILPYSPRVSITNINPFLNAFVERTDLPLSDFIQTVCFGLGADIDISRIVEPRKTGDMYVEIVFSGVTHPFPGQRRPNERLVLRRQVMSIYDYCYYENGNLRSTEEVIDFLSVTGFACSLDNWNFISEIHLKALETFSSKELLDKLLEAGGLYKLQMAYKESKKVLKTVKLQMNDIARVLIRGQEISKQVEEQSKFTKDAVAPILKKIRCKMYLLKIITQRILNSRIQYCQGQYGLLLDKQNEDHQELLESTESYNATLKSQKALIELINQSNHYRVVEMASEKFILQYKPVKPVNSVKIEELDEELDEELEEDEIENTEDYFMAQIEKDLKQDQDLKIKHMEEHGVPSVVPDIDVSKMIMGFREFEFLVACCNNKLPISEFQEEYTEHLDRKISSINHQLNEVGDLVNQIHRNIQEIRTENETLNYSEDIEIRINQANEHLDRIHQQFDSYQNDTEVSELYNQLYSLIKTETFSAEELCQVYNYYVVKKAVIDLNLQPHEHLGTIIEVLDIDKEFIGSCNEILGGGWFTHIVSTRKIADLISESLDEDDLQFICIDELPSTTLLHDHPALEEYLCDKIKSKSQYGNLENLINLFFGEYAIVTDFEMGNKLFMELNVSSVSRDGFIVNHMGMMSFYSPEFQKFHCLLGIISLYNMIIKTEMSKLEEYRIEELKTELKNLKISKESNNTTAGVALKRDYNERKLQCMLSYSKTLAACINILENERKTLKGLKQLTMKDEVVAKYMEKPYPTEMEETLHDMLSQARMNELAKAQIIIKDLDVEHTDEFNQLYRDFISAEDIHDTEEEDKLVDMLKSTSLHDSMMNLNEMKNRDVLNKFDSDNMKEKIEWHQDLLKTVLKDVRDLRPHVDSETLEIAERITNTKAITEIEEIVNVKNLETTLKRLKTSCFRKLREPPDDYLCDDSSSDEYVSSEDERTDTKRKDFKSEKENEEEVDKKLEEFFASVQDVASRSRKTSKSQGSHVLQSTELAEVKANWIQMNKTLKDLESNHPPKVREYLDKVSKRFSHYFQVLCGKQSELLLYKNKSEIIGVALQVDEKYKRVGTLALLFAIQEASASHIFLYDRIDLFLSYEESEKLAAVLGEISRSHLSQMLCATYYDDVPGFNYNEDLGVFGETFEMIEDPESELSNY